MGQRHTLGRAARFYVAALALAALGLAGVLLASARPPGGDDVPLALAFVLLLAVAYLFPLHFAPSTKVTLGTSVLFAAVLLFPPPIAVLIAGAGRGLAAAARRRGPAETVLNTSQTVLQAGTGGLLLTAAGWSDHPLRFNSAEQLLAVLAAALAMYVINTLSVATVIALDAGESPLLVWHHSVARADAFERLSQMVLGLLLAMVTDAHVWVLPLLFVPAYGIYHLSKLHNRLEEQTRTLEHRAFHDPLTGLPNRALYDDRLQRALARASGQPKRVAVFFLDLDNLKLVNDRYGHHAGDQLLVAVANRLGACLRPEDTAARLGGDEFAVLVEGIASAKQATRIASRIREQLHAPFTLGEHEVSITVSIGITLSSSPTRESGADLLRLADEAMYRAKRAGKARYELA